MPAPLQPVRMDTPLSQHDPQASPYSPTLINLNNRYNMSASSLTEALLLLSGMYISLVQPEPGPIKIGLHGVFPRTSGTFRSAITDPFSERNKFRTFSDYRALPSVFDIATSYTRSEYAPKELLDMLCKDVFPKNTITIFYINNHLGLHQYPSPAVRYLPRILESLGLPIISYDTQFSPNSRPALSIQLAPTMGQMMDVIFAFLKKFHWTDFSFLCTLSYGCLDEITSIRTKVDEFQQKSNFSVYGFETYAYKLLSYVNFTNGKNKEEVVEKLKYELHKDSRINLVHGSGAEVKTIMDIAKELGLTGQEYVWIFTAASISVSQESKVVDESYPLGSFIIGFNSSRDDMENVVRAGINLWLQALNSLVTSPDFENIDFKTGFSCDRVKDGVALKTNNTGRAQLFWKHGELLYKYILKSNLPGDLKFDEYGVLKTNKFWILNVQHEDPHIYPEDHYSGRIGGHNLISNVAGNSGQHHFDSGFLMQRPFNSEVNEQSHSEGDDREPSSSFSWRKITKLPFTKNRDSILRFPENEYEDSVSQISVERRSRSSRGSDAKITPKINLDMPRTTERVFKPEVGNHKISSTGSDSSLPVFKDRTYTSPFSDKIHSTPVTPQDGVPRTTSTSKVSELPLFNRAKMKYRTHKDKRASSFFMNETPGFFPGKPTFSSSFHSSRADRSTNVSDPYGVDTYNTTYFLPINSTLFFHLTGSDSVKLTPSPITSNKSTRAKDPHLSLSERHFINWHRSSNLFDHNKGRRQKNYHKNTHSHRSCGNMNIKETKQSRNFLQFHNRSFGHQNEDIADRSRRQVKRQVVKRQISKKIAEWDGHNLSLAGIVWPGGNSQPPKGKPEKYILRVVTWKEDPHVIYLEKQNNMSDGGGSCDVNSLPCQVYVRNKNLQRTNKTKDMCCTGLCIDLLKKLGQMLHFNVQLSEVHDGGYGSPLNKNLTNWNGMLGMLIHNEADMAIGALSITPERSVAVDFSVPYLQTGIAIIVAIREGVISPAAFLEPYDYPSWSLILVFSVHATGASIFIFEWLSPYGLNQGKTSLSVHKFSLFRSFWLIWAMLFGASVSTDQPKGIASRFLANIWALFAVVFCASYTANLAAFMITKDDYYDLSGIQDWRLRNPHHRQPPFKFATIANSSTDLNIAKNFEGIHRYMRSEAQTDVKDAIRNLKNGLIQAFIYDSTTLEYEVGKDDFCKLKTVGKRIAETGYGVAFPKKSQWVEEVNKALLQLQEQGDIERLQKFWLSGACHKKKEPGVSSHTLGILNFTSAFILLGAGVILGVLLLILEHTYFRFGRKSLKKWDKHGCCSLVSLSMGKSLTFEQSVMEAMDYHKHHKCRDPLCETQLWKIRYDLDIALLKISQLRKQIAHSASARSARRRDSAVSTESDLDIAQHQNDTARRRRQQSSDKSPNCIDDFVNHPLLALEGRNHTTDDDISCSSSTHRFAQFSPQSSYSETRNMVPLRENNIPLQNIHLSHCEKRLSQDFKIDMGCHIIDRPITTTTKMSSYDGIKAETDLNVHSLPSSFDESVSGYVSSAEEMIPTSSINPSFSLPHTPFSSYSTIHPRQSHNINEMYYSNSNADNLYSSLNDRHFVPTIPGSPSSFSLSDDCKIHLKSPCAISNKSHTTALSENTDYQGTICSSNPEESSGLMNDCDDCQAVGYNVPTVARTGSHLKNAHTNSNYSISSENTVRHSGERSNVKPEIKKSNLVHSSRRNSGNDVNGRQLPDNFSNVYVNVDEIIGKETSF